MAFKLIARGDTGLYLSSGETSDSQVKSIDSSKTCKVIKFNHKGTKLAWSDGKSVKIQDLTNDKVTSIPVEKTQFLQWSPQDNFLSTWEVYAVKNGQKAEANCRIWTSCGELKFQFIQRKADGWEPRWSQDENLVAIRTMNNEVAYYQGQNFENFTKKLSLAKMDSFSTSPNLNHIVAFVPGSKGNPGFAKLFAYPNFNVEKDAIAFKSSMLADKMEAKWSHNSQNVLLLMQAEVDKTGSSYYGKTQLHSMDIQGETAFMQLPKDGPIYHVSWAPDKAQFCVVYGFMPAKATLFDKRGEKLFDFGTGPRNLALFNPQGNLLMLGGFGNLRGKIEIWNVQDKKQVSLFDAPDSTDVKWSPDGQEILTTTCAPRLRVNNGFKIWHYTSTLFHETFYRDPTGDKPGEELWEATWKPDPELKLKKFAILDKPIQGGIKPKQPQASKQAYVPPNARGKAKSSTKLHNEDELPENMKKSASGKNGAEENLSKSAAKNKKRREAAKKKREEENENDNAVIKNEQNESNFTTGDPEKDKKIRKVNDKLAQIAKLKEQVKSGKALEANQLDKIKKEAEFLEELRKLKL